MRTEKLEELESEALPREVVGTITKIDSISTCGRRKRQRKGVVNNNKPFGGIIRKELFYIIIIYSYDAYPRADSYSLRKTERSTD